MVTFWVSLWWYHDMDSMFSLLLETVINDLKCNQIRERISETPEQILKTVQKSNRIYMHSLSCMAFST